MTNHLINLIRGWQAESRETLSSSGRKIVGTLCLASPLELCDAVGAVPVRLMSSSDEAELRGGKFLASDSCSFCKAVLGGLDLVNPRPDAVLGSTTCDQMRRNLEIISRDLQIPVFIFNAPRTTDNPLAREYARHDLLRLSEEISAWAEQQIAPETLTAALQHRSAVNQRMRVLLKKRESDQPALRGGEFQALMAYYQTAALEDFERTLPQIEDFISYREPLYRQKPWRIALLGSCLGADDHQIIELVEETGRAVIVYDAICSGSRALREGSALHEDPIETLVEHYHDQVLCPHKRPNDRLFEKVVRDVRRLGVQGVIFKTLKFCHPWGFEARRFKEILGLPFLHLDHDYSPSAIGQLRTRIHAFLEALTLSR